MKRIITILATLLLTPLLAACGSEMQARYAEPTTLASKNGPQTICIASDLGEQFHYSVVGLTMFGNEFKTSQTKGWSLDDLTIDTLAKQVGPATSTKRVPKPSGLGSYYNPPGLFSGAPDAGLAREERLGKSLAAQYGQDGCTSYLFALRGHAQFMNTKIAVPGVGIVHGTLLASKNRFLHVVFDLLFYDGRTLALVNKKRVGWKPELFGGSSVKGLHQRADQSWPNEIEQMVADERIKTATRALMVDGLTKTLPDVINLGRTKI